MNSKNYRILMAIAAPIIVICFLRCSNEYSSVSQKEGNFYLNLGEESEKELYKLTGKKVYLPGNATIYYGDKKINHGEITTRGQNTLEFRRKNFSVDVDGKVRFVDPSASDTIETGKFILSSMSMDDSYFGNKFSYEILKRIGLWPFNSFYTRLFINNENQGLYLYTDDLKDYAFKHLKAKFILRRGYHGTVSGVYYNGKNDITSKALRGYNRILAAKIGTPKMKLLPDFYVDRFNSLYGFLPKYNGKQLFDSISSVLNLDSYMKKMVVDNILKNGDYTDEVFFYSKSNPLGIIYFDILPWDYDDVFMDLPHEIGRTDTLCGKIFGIRTYPTYFDHEIETQGRLIFSIEDDLDYIIMKDDYLYQRYLECFREVLTQVDSSFVELTFTKTYQQLRPFFDDKNVIEQSKYDENETSIELMETQVNEKKKLVTDRIRFYKAKLDSLWMKAVLN